MDPDVISSMVTGRPLEIKSSTTVEEGLDCRDENSRFFSLLDRDSRLNIIVSKTAAILSCKLDDREIIVDGSCYNESHDTHALGDRPYQKLNSLPWTCHVRGDQLVLSTTNGSSSISYELIQRNELRTLVKLKSIHLQHQMTYFNLRNTSGKTCTDGHTLVVQCNGGLDKIQAQNTRLSCRCNVNSSIPPQSLIGETPRELRASNFPVDHNGVVKFEKNCLNNDENALVCDAIYSLEATDQSDYISVRLQCSNVGLVVEVRPCLVSSSPGSHANNANAAQNNPSSSTSAKPNQGRTSTPNATAHVSPHPTTVLRVRVRVTNFGICILPFMMANYRCSYRFIW